MKQFIIIIIIASFAYTQNNRNILSNDTKESVIRSEQLS